MESDKNMKKKVHVLLVLDYINSNSMIQTDVIPETGEQILTLSTCTSTDDQKYRFVVNGLLEKTESTVQRSFPEK